MKNSNIIIVKYEWDSKFYFDWIFFFSGSDVFYSFKEDRSVWSIGVVVLGGDDI